MDIYKSILLMDKYGKCPECDSEHIGNGEGSISIKGDEFRRFCKCGFDITVDEDGKKIEKYKCDECKYFMYATADNHAEYYCNYNEEKISDLKVCNNFSNYRGENTMHNLKSRIFNGLYMDEVIGYDFNCGGINEDLILVWDKETGMKHYDSEDIQIMKSSGMKDKNGKEIYEGDIIQCNGKKDDLHEVKFGEFELYNIDTEEAIDHVVGWYFKILDNDIFSNVEPFCFPTPLNSHWIDKIDIQVIGNIYENKDLLE